MTREAGPYYIDESTVLDDVPLDTATAQLAARLEEYLATDRLRAHTHSWLISDNVSLNGDKASYTPDHLVGMGHPLRLSAPERWRAVPFLWPVSERAESLSVTVTGTVGNTNTSAVLQMGLSLSPRPPTSYTTVSTTGTAVLPFSVAVEPGLQVAYLWVRAEVDEDTDLSPTHWKLLEVENVLHPVEVTTELVQSLTGSDGAVPSWVQSTGLYERPPVVLAATTTTATEEKYTDWKQVVQSFDSEPWCRISPPFTTGLYDAGELLYSLASLILIGRQHAYIDVHSIHIEEVGGDARSSPGWDTGEQWSMTRLSALIDRLVGHDRTTAVWGVFPSLGEDPWGELGMRYPTSDGAGDAQESVCWILVDRTEARVTSYRLHLLATDTRAGQGTGEREWVVYPRWWTWDGSTWVTDLTDIEYGSLTTGSRQDEQPQITSIRRRGNAPCVTEGRLLDSEAGKVQVLSMDLDPSDYPDDPMLLEVRLYGDRSGARAYIHSAVLEGVPDTQAVSRGDYLRASAIVSDDVADLIDYAQDLARGRCKCLWSHSWHYYSTPNVVGYSYDTDGGDSGSVSDQIRITPHTPRVKVVTWGDIGVITVTAYDDEDQTTELWRCTHTHGTATTTRVESARWVTPGTTIYCDLGVNDHPDYAGDMTIEAALIYEDDLTVTDLRAEPPEYATIAIAEAALGTATRETISVNGRVLVNRPGSETHVSAANTWVPWLFRNAELATAYRGGVQTSAVPNITWGWTGDDSGGSVSVSGDVTTITDSSGAAASYIADAHAVSGGALVFTRAYVSEAGAGDHPFVSVDNGTDSAILLLGDSGTEGSTAWSTGGTAAVTTDTATTATELMLEVDSALTHVKAYVYQTQQLVCVEDVSALAASSGTALVTVGVGTSETGTLELHGHPALAVWVRPWD